MAAKPDLREEAARVAADLGRLIAAEALPGPAMPRAESLHEALIRPVRVTLMGPAGSAKSAALDLLAGARVVPAPPPGLRPPRLILRGGDASRGVLWFDGGARRELSPAEAADPAAIRAAMAEGGVPAELELWRADLPALRRITLTEMTIDPAQPASMQAAQDAAAETDVAIWCTRIWTVAESSAWAKMPDRLAGDGILLMAFRDQADDPAAALARLTGLQGSEFDKVIGADMLAALAARAPSGRIDKARMTASGGADLIRAVRRLIDRGLQAALDRAEVMLLQHADLLARLPEAAPAPAPEPEPAPAPPIPSPAPAAEAPAPAPTAPRRVEPPAPDPVPAPTPVPAAVPSPAAPRAVPAGREALAAASASLAGLGSDLAASGESPLKRALRVVDGFVEDLEDAPEDVVRVAEGAQDLLQLIRLEGGTAGDFEAAALLLQLRLACEQALVRPVDAAA